MLKIGDVIQLNTGGPKMKISEMADGEIIAKRLDNDETVATTIDKVSIYSENSDFGVC